MSPDPAVARTAALLDGWVAGDPTQRELRRRYLRHLAVDPHALGRVGAVHLTGSCLVLDADRRNLLLVHHVKGGFWVQPGGHWEPGDVDLAATAAREVAEETGLVVQLEGVHDLHAHRLSAAFGSCTEHLDVMFWATADPQSAPIASPESRAAQWFPVDRLPMGVVADLAGRITAEGLDPRRRPPGQGR